MHNLDRTRLEGDFEQGFEGHRDEPFDGEFEAFEADSYSEEEGEGEWELESQYNNATQGSPFDESEEMEFAAELVEVAGDADDAELELFLGRLVNRARRGLRKAGRKVRRAVGGRVGQALRRGVRKIARRALPIAGGAIGGPAGAAAAGTIGRAFGLELEGLSPEDQEFEGARKLVRLAGEATSMAAAVPESVPDEEAAATALRMAVRKHAPGLAGRGDAAAGDGRQPQSGRWVRRGSQIILRGV
jgi:hypothetical protein